MLVIYPVNFLKFIKGVRPSRPTVPASQSQFQPPELPELEEASAYGSSGKLWQVARDLASLIGLPAGFSHTIIRLISNALRQFFEDVDWGPLDLLLIDLPPGTSDAPLTVMQALPLDGVVIVSSPQMLATMIVTKCVNMVRHLKGTIIGIVENMSYFQTPDGERYELFGPSRGSELVGVTGAPLLGTLPIDPAITTLCDTGRIEEYDSEAYGELAVKFVNTLKIQR